MARPKTTRHPTFTASRPFAPATYRPSVVEWGISIGLVAATIFLFGLGARLMPVLPAAEDTVHGQQSPARGERGGRSRAAAALAVSHQVWGA
jgi:Ni/Fe-hydrogenase subunit HybB-like protein